MIPKKKRTGEKNRRGRRGGGGEMKLKRGDKGEW